jgi:hypothetical protein
MGLIDDRSSISIHAVYSVSVCTYCSVAHLTSELARIK